MSQQCGLLGHALRKGEVSALGGEELQLLGSLLHLQRRDRRAEGHLVPAAVAKWEQAAREML